MKSRLWALVLAVVCVIGVTAGFAAKDKASAPAPRLYLACNIWFERPDKIYSTGYQKGTILPAGTEVEDVQYKSRAIRFKDAQTKTEYAVEWVDKHRPGVSLKQFGERLLTEKDFAALTHGFSAAEIEAIKAGEIRVGMSKAAVLVAAGYPPEIRTPGTDTNTWVYWHDRFRNYPVEFADGKVSRVQFK
jgi:hypothetical protein